MCGVVEGSLLLPRRPVGRGTRLGRAAPSGARSGLLSPSAIPRCRGGGEGPLDGGHLRGEVPDGHEDLVQGIDEAYQDPDGDGGGEYFPGAVPDDQAHTDGGYAFDDGIQGRVIDIGAGLRVKKTLGETPVTLGDFPLSIVELDCFDPRQAFLQVAGAL